MLKPKLIKKKPVKKMSDEDSGKPSRKSQSERKFLLPLPKMAEVGKQSGQLERGESTLEIGKRSTA